MFLDISGRCTELRPIVYHFLVLLSVQVCVCEQFDQVWLAKYSFLSFFDPFAEKNCLIANRSFKKVLFI